MFLQNEEDVLAALSNAFNVLNKDGIFLWYEANSRGHFDEMKKGGIDSTGYSTMEMDSLATRVGFKLTGKMQLYKQITLGSISTSTYYLSQDHSALFCELLNLLLPTKPVINIRMYTK